MYHLLLNGILEERYFTLGMLPILGDDGSVQGFYEPLTDVTEEHLATRRQLSIQKVSDETAGVQNLNDFFAHTLDALRENKHDIPYCLLYSVVSEQRKDDAQHPPAVDKTDFNFARLEGAIGVRLEDDGKPIALLLEDDNFKRYFQQACQLGEFITFDIPPHLRDDIMEDPGERGFGDAPHRLVLCPITPMTEKTTTALMVLGVNTRAPLVPEYMAFIRSLSRTISASLASVMLLNIASRRTLEAVHGEQVAKGMLNVAPVGAYLITMDGEILYANPTWYELTDYNNYQNEQSPMSWMEAIADDFQDTMRKEWELLVTEHRSRSFEIRLKKEWKGICNVSGEIIRGPSYMLADAAVQTIDGAVYITGCMTDISRQKWAEDREKKRREEAVELKREQENFIDMTSHEMRNPLSAILQSADSIVSTLTAYQKSDFGPNLGTCPDTPKLDFPKAEERIAYAIEAAATIVLFDANRLEISPVDVQPLALIGQSLRMFAAELESNDAQMETQAEASFQELEVSWVKMDTSRLLQVLINLYTNAIKFTAAGVTRQIQVSLGASRQPPTLEEYGVHWLSTEKGKVKDPTTAMEWGDGEQLYLSFAVQDTGRGMNEEEMKSLFQRFQQASPRTHTQYGGSGLGLYIARLLTNIQGGEIGVVSVPEKGSTFAFYIKVRRSELSAESALDLNEPKFNGFDSMDLSTLAPAKSPSPSEGLEIHVLVVEDNVVNQRVLRRQLQNLDWTVHVANNGQESIDFLKTTQFWKGNEITGTPLTLVLMDVEMPVMNGLMATREIRRLQSDQLIVEHVPIIAITANARMEQVAVTRESGMDDVVSKPFRIPELVAKVKALIGTGS
ncbi:putative hsp90-like protein [Phaeomoniella chlamydospora]|uniref:Putative hsp90-like protein n=1 Tax=Phaeomoniella chlamydospora TaxID=158046 RepID=A0A0G2DUT8_PHACM|nr:putative hsp90-like protein [Phaeomoniella chlamydospora]